MKEQIIQSLGGTDLVRVKPNFGRHFYCIKRAERTVSRTYDTIKVARKVLRLHAAASPYPVIPQARRSNSRSTDEYERS